MSEQENTRIVKLLYETFMKGDIEGLFKLYADDMEWEVPGPADLPIAGKHRGHDQIRQIFTKLASEFEFQKFESQDFIAQGDKVVALGESALRVKSIYRVYCQKQMVTCVNLK